MLHDIRSMAESGVDGVDGVDGEDGEDQGVEGVERDSCAIVVDTGGGQEAVEMVWDSQR